MERPYNEWTSEEQERLAQFLEDPQNKGCIARLGHERCFVCGNKATTSIIYKPENQACGIMSLCPNCQSQLTALALRNN